MTISINTPKAPPVGSVTRDRLAADVAASVPIRAGQVVIGTPTGPKAITSANPTELLSSQLDDFRDVAAWTATGGGTAEADTSDGEHPNAISVTTAEGVSTTITRDLVVSLHNRFLSFWLKRTDDNFASLVVGLSVNGRSFTQRFENTAIRKDTTVQDRWRRVTVQNPAYTAAGSPTPTGVDFADVRSLRFVVAPATGTITNVVIADLRMHDEPLEPGLIWQFDDGRADTYTTAFPILSDNGIKGAISLETGNVDNADRCTLAQLQEMVTAGWELNSHTVSGQGLSSSIMSTLRTQLRDSYSWLMANGFPQGARYFVYPGGIWDDTILTEVLRHYKTARIAGGQNYQSPGVAEYGLLLPYYLTKPPGVSLANAKASLDRLADRGGIANLVFHSIVETPVATEDWSISDFTALAEYANELGLQSYVPSEVWP